MKAVGITGGIGSGKTTVCRIFELLGVPVFYSDVEAKKFYDEEKTKRKVVNAFGKKILDKAGMINKRKLAQIVFSNKRSLSQINSIIHPLVRQKFEVWKKKQKSVKYVIKEAAILIESGDYKELNHLISVNSSKSLVIRRINKDKKLAFNDLKRRMDKQLSDKEREKYSGTIILNDGYHSLIEQVLRIHHKFLKK